MAASTSTATSTLVAPSIATFGLARKVGAEATLGAALGATSYQLVRCGGDPGDAKGCC